MRYDDREDLQNKVDYEGGLLESILGYGINHEDLPLDTPAEIVQAWQTIEAVSPEERFIGIWLETGKLKPEVLKQRKS